MTLATSPMSPFSTSIEAQQAALLLEGYRFELGGHSARQWVTLWLELYRPIWIRDAVIEALYQGRYKSRSVKQILELWTRRAQPIRHATHEFEAAVCREFGEVKLVTTLPKSALEPKLKSTKIYRKDPAKERASRRIHQSLSAIASSSTRLVPANRSTNAMAGGSGNDIAASRRLVATGPAETADVLRSHRQQNGIPFSSARAIQPFKPALPFSAQPLRQSERKVSTRKPNAAREPNATSELKRVVAAT